MKVLHKVVATPIETESWTENQALSKSLVEAAISRSRALSGEEKYSLLTTATLLAKADRDLKRHLISGPRNARCVSKTIQNELLSIGADKNRSFYQKCLNFESLQMEQHLVEEKFWLYACAL